MIRVSITASLVKEIGKTFGRAEALTVLDRIESLAEQPRKGKILGTINNILIKELKYKKYRFYFLVDGEQLRFLDKNMLVDLLIRFVRMSDKKKQQRTIEEIKQLLVVIGPAGFV